MTLRSLFRCSLLLQLCALANVLTRETILRERNDGIGDSCYLVKAVTQDVFKCGMEFSETGCILPYNYEVSSKKEETREIIYNEEELDETFSLIEMYIPHFRSDFRVTSSALSIIKEIERCLNATCQSPPDVNEGEASPNLEGELVPRDPHSLVSFAIGVPECQDAGGVLLTKRVPLPVSSKSSQPTAGGGMKKVRDPSCLSENFKHEFEEANSTLRFYFGAQNAAFYSNTVPTKLFRYAGLDVNVLSKETCENLSIFEGATFFQPQLLKCAKKRYNQPFVEFLNLPTGCYTVRANPGCFYRTVWLETQHFIQMEKLNTSIGLFPRDHESSLEVRWSQHGSPYFTKWHLEIWFMTEGEITCYSRQTMKGHSRRLEAPGLIEDNSFTFYNLSVGSYCALLTPIDQRCPNFGCSLYEADGCWPIGSYTAYLSAKPTQAVIENPKMNSALIGFLVFVSFISGISITLLCLRFNRVSTKKLPFYKIVPQNEKTNKVVALLIWTKYTPENKPDFEPIIKAFKKLLSGYCRCTVYDYLEPTKLPPEERQRLLKADIGWLQAHLNGDIKKIFVCTEGAALLQKSHCNKDHTINTEDMDDIDSRLFSFVLRYIQDSIHLASDYQRTFQVSFSGTSENNAMLEGIVSNVRFNLPEHLRLLRMRLHGLYDENSHHIPHPTHEQLRELRAAIKNARNSVHCQDQIRPKQIKAFA